MNKSLLGEDQSMEAGDADGVSHPLPVETSNDV